MQYGPAVQASIGGIYLIDKLHTGCSGEYLELISTDSTEDMVTVLYRKVRTEKCKMQILLGTGRDNIMK